MMHPSCNSLARCSLPLASLALALLASQSAQAATCPELLGREIPAQAIGLPTSGARVTAATVAAGGAPQTFGAIAMSAPRFVRSIPPHRQSACAWCCPNNGTARR